SAPTLVRSRSDFASAQRRHSPEQQQIAPGIVSVSWWHACSVVRERPAILARRAMENVSSMTMVVWLLIAAAVLWLTVVSVRLATISDLKSFPGGFRRF